MIDAETRSEDKARIEIGMGLTLKEIIEIGIMINKVLDNKALLILDNSNKVLDNSMTDLLHLKEEGDHRLKDSIMDHNNALFNEEVMEAHNREGDLLLIVNKDVVIVLHANHVATTIKDSEDIRSGLQLLYCNHNITTMSRTVSDKIKDISVSIDAAFGELAALMLRKSIIVSSRSVKVFNPYRKKYESGISKDSVSDYTYSMIHESLGWNGDILASFRIKPRGAKNDVIRERSKVPFMKSKGSCCDYRKLLSNLSATSLILNNKACYEYVTDVSYGDVLKQLQSIGQDIIDQTDASLCPQVVARLSTALLRSKLFDLEQLLSQFSEQDPELFDSYLEMVRLINSVPKTKIYWVINLISSLTYQRFQDIKGSQQSHFIHHLGQDFIDAFNSNSLIIILLQSDHSDLIITVSYLYPLLKMLFIVFGYSNLSPVVIETCVILPTFDTGKNRGSFIKRGDPDYIPLHCYGEAINVTRCEPDVTPIPQADYDYIKLFTDLYPIIIGLMGGAERFPEDTPVSLEEIPTNYDYLPTISDYLWRFNDFSFCIYSNRQKCDVISEITSAKVNNKTRYLLSI